MADCTCCGCVTVDNYRGQRQRPENVTFAVWCNSDREFFDVENNAVTTFPTTVASEVDDGGGPWRLVSGGGWVAGPMSGYTPYNTGKAFQTASGGTLTLYGVYGNAFTVNVVGIASASIRAFGEQPDFSVVSFDAIRISGGLQMDYAGSTLVTVGLGQGVATIPGPTAENNERPCVIERYSSSGLSDDMGVSGLVTTRRRRGSTRNLLVTSSTQITHQFSVSTAGPQPSVNYPNYYRASVRLQGAKGSLYKNGALVWEATRPQPADSESHTSGDGVYLWVSEVLEAADPPYTGVGIDDRIRVASPLKRQQSFVVDTELPVFGFPPPNDFYIDRVADITGQRPYLVATKPIRDWLSADVPQADVTVRPKFVPLTGSAPNGRWSSEGTGASAASLGAGTTTVKPQVMLTTTFADLSTLRDYAGNLANPDSLPTFRLTIHPVPENNRRGARPLLEDIGLQTREYGRARLQSERVNTVRLTFDRKVDADTVNDSQLTLTKDGGDVEGCSITQVSDVEWLVTLPAAADQSPKSFWVLEYSPGGVVMTDDIDQIEHDSFDKFPTTSRSVYRRVYVAKDTGRRYSKAPGGYVEIGQGNPRDENGIEFEPEPCRLATRISWLMASENGWLKPLDTSSEDFVIGDTMSISKTIASLPAQDGTLKITSTGGLIYNFGETRQGTYADGFTPRVPNQTSPPNDCSYWGLTTTIDPCPPAAIRCPVAKTAQRHASILRRDSELETFLLSLVQRDATTGEELDSTGIDSLFGPITMGRTVDGKTIAQNVWFGLLPSTLRPNPEIPMPSGLSAADAFWGYAYKDAATGIRYSKSVDGWVAIGSGEPIGPDGEAYPHTGRVRGEVWFPAMRRASQYSGLKTSMLWELEIDPTIAMVIRGVNGTTGALSDSTLFTPTRIVLSKDKEDLWNDGATFYVSGNGVWWKFEPV